MYKINDKWIMKITDVKEYRITEELQGHPNIVYMLPMSRRMLSKGYVNNDLWRDRGEHLANFFVRGNGTVVLGDFGDTDRVNSKNLIKLSEHINKIIEYINIY